jgi:hypothetical protein
VTVHLERSRQLGSSLGSTQSRLSQPERDLLSRLQDDVSHLKARSGSINSCPLEHEIQCLKHEVRSLKRHPVAWEVFDSPVFHDPLRHLSSELAELKGCLTTGDELAEKGEALSAAISGSRLEQLSHDVEDVKSQLDEIFAVNSGDIVHRSSRMANLASAVGDGVQKSVTGVMKLQLRSINQKLKWTAAAHPGDDSEPESD